VARTRPRWVIYQAGYRNRFGHPADEVLARYEGVGAQTLRTDHAGAIQVRAHREGAVTIETMRQARARYWHNRPRAVQETDEADDTASSDDALVVPLQPE